MRLHEIPALPFALDVRSAAEWLDQLPLANVRECCRLLFPVIQALNVYPMPARLRFELLEKFHPIVLGVVRDLQIHFLGNPFPRDPKARKLAGLPARFHLEAADGYRQLLKDEASRDAMSAGERGLILRRALEHLSRHLWRAAQAYEHPSSSIDSSLNKLYRYALSGGLLNDAVTVEREGAVSPHSLFARIALFRLAAPGRLTQTDMQRLFDRFQVRGTAADTGEGSEDGTGRGVFYYDPQDINLLVPAWSTSPPLPKLPFFSPEPFLASFRADFRVSGHADRDPLTRALSRIGERLPCQELSAGRRVILCLGFDPIASMVRDLEARRQPGSAHSGPWPGSNQLELVPLEPTPAPFFGRRSLASALSETESKEGKRRIEIVPTDLPGFYLIDSERRALRAGQLLGMNSNDEWIQLAAVRGGQIRDGRFWHSVEVLGTQVCAVKADREGNRDDSRNALLLDEGAEEPTLVLPPSHWHRDSVISVKRRREKRYYRIANLLEATADFCQYLLAEVDSAEGS